MSKVQSAIRDMHTLDELAARPTFLARVHPAAKLIVTIAFLAAAVSFDKYDLTGLLGLAPVLIVLAELGEVPLGPALRQMRVLLGLLLFVGIANPLLDRTVAAVWLGVPVTGGVISCLTLFLKGAFALTASYILAATTGIEQICYALQVLHCPRVLTTVFLLIDRYILLFLQQTQRVTLAYAMRAPRQKGVNIRAWGSLAGGMLLHSIDRAETVYQSMLLRGFDGSFRLHGSREPGQNVKSAAYLAGTLVLIFALRIVPVFELVGGLL